MLYYYPNRPRLVPPDPKNPMNPSPDYLNSLEAKRQYRAGRKWNGDNSLVYTDDLSFLWGREKNRLRYSPTPAVKAELERFPKGCILNAELMHYHTKGIKDTIIVHCLMAYKGEPLLGKTWGDSRKILESFSYGDHVRLEELHDTGFFDLWSQADGETTEGIVLKDPSGILQFSCTPLKDVSWMLKVRKRCKKYPF